MDKPKQIIAIGIEKFGDEASTSGDIYLNNMHIYLEFVFLFIHLPF